MVNVDFNDITAIVEAQRVWLEKLQAVNSLGTIKIKAIESGKPNPAGKYDPDLYDWMNYADVWHKITYPIYTRGILLNEILIDPDSENWYDVRDGIRKLHLFCEENSIPHIMGFSGGKGIHFSIVFGKITAGDEESNKALFEDVDKYNIDARKIARRALLFELAERAGVDLEKIGMDKRKINFHTNKLGSQVREFGTIREPGKYKTFITDIPDEKPTPGELPLVFPDNVEIWNIRDTEYNEIAIEAIRKEIEKAKNADEYTPISDENFKDIQITKFPCIDKLFKVGVRNGRYYAGVAVVLMCQKCGISKEETEKHLKTLFKTFPGISQADADLRINNALEMYGKEYHFSCTEIKETFSEHNLCNFAECPIKAKIEEERKTQHEADTRDMLNSALTDIKPSPDKSIRIQQLKEFVSNCLIHVDVNLAEEILLMNVKNPFDFNNDEFRLIKNFYKSEYKKEQERKRKEEWEKREYAPISFGKTANASARAMAILTKEFKDNHTPVFSIGGELYAFNSRIYEKKDSALAELKTFLYEQTKLHGIEISPTNVNNVLKRIIDENTIEPADLNKAPERLVVKNGILDVITKELYPHTSDEKHITELDIQYDPDVKISEDFENYLNSTFQGVEWEIKLLQEAFGYCLHKSYFIEVFFFLVGNGGNGRTVTTNLLTTFLGGNKNVSSMKLQEICNPHDAYSLMGLHGKFANICGETGVEGVTDMSNLKAATGRDPIRARQPYKSWVEFYSFAKQFFSMNQVPVINDATRGRKRRMKTINFPNEFVVGENADEKLENKLMSDESLTGILNWSLEGLDRLLEEGKFTDIRSEAQIANEFEKKSNPVRYFVHEHIDDVMAEHELDDSKAKVAYSDSRVTEAQIFQAYTAYAKLHNLPSLAPKNIIASVKYECEKVGIFVKTCRDRYRRDEHDNPITRENFFKGIKLCGLKELGIYHKPIIPQPNEEEQKTETQQSNTTKQPSINTAVAGETA